MTRLQFRVLYEQFLFRAVDLELLSASAHGDASKLLGQFASLLVFVSLLLALAGMVFGGSDLPSPAHLSATWGIEHFLISTTMLVVGLFAVLSWDPCSRIDATFWYSLLCPYARELCFWPK